MRSGHVKINRCLILMLSVILGAYILWNMGVFSWDMIWEEITDMLVRQSAECYLPGMVYVAEASPLLTVNVQVFPPSTVMGELAEASGLFSAI